MPDLPSGTKVEFNLLSAEALLVEVYRGYSVVHYDGRCDGVVTPWNRLDLRGCFSSLLWYILPAVFGDSGPTEGISWATPRISTYG